MGLGLFLLPTIGGYWLLTHLNYTRYRTFRESGYHLLFNSAFAGVILFGAAQVTSLFLDHCFPQLDVWWAHYFSTPHSDTAVLSVVLGIAVPLAANCLYDSDRAARRAAKENNDLEEPSHISDEDFRVVIPISEIVSARLFFPEAYELFREQADESLEDV